MLRISSFLIFLYTFVNMAVGQTSAHMQPKPSTPIPVEMLAGNKNMYYQMVVKKSLSPTSKFNLFGLSTYTSNYKNNVSDNRLIVISQLGYNLGKGFGMMVGTDINSVSGFSAVAGPQHHFANKEILAITVASYFLNGKSDIKLFGLYEYKPALTNDWSLYNRFQFVYNHGAKENLHNVSYIYLRTGLKYKSFIFGVGGNIDWSGPHKHFNQNYGGFVRWELR